MTQSVGDARAQLEELIGELAIEYSDRLRAGEKPAVEEYVQRHPEAAEAIRQILPALEIMGAVPDSEVAVSESPSDAGSQRGMIGEYRIIREIGRGGMGVVYEAEQLSLSRRVALKVLPFAAVLDERQIKRFRNEAMAAAQLDHPHIVDVYGVGCERSVHFYAMRYIEGEPLAHVIEQLRKTPGAPGGEEAVPTVISDQEVVGEPEDHGEASDNGRESSRDTAVAAALSTQRSAGGSEYFRSAAKIGIEVAEALDYAHEQGIVHRDVKPGNILIDRGGKAWVTDFGLARIETGATLTMTGDLLGTLRYMSPEQALAKRVVVDHRTDVYSLGVTLYELLTLQPAYGDEERHELLRKIAFEDPSPPRRINRAIPAELETIVTKAISKSAHDRYETAQELADDLRRFLEHKPIKARPPGLVQVAAKWTRRHSGLVTTATLVTLLLLVCGLIGLSVSNHFVTQERNEKEDALSEKEQALGDLTAAYADREAEWARAEANVELALEALDAVYLAAIGEKRLLQEEELLFDEETGELIAGSSTPTIPLSDREREILETGLAFYEQVAEQNSRSATVRRRGAAAYRRIGGIHAALGDSDAARMAWQAAIERLVLLTEETPEDVESLRELGRAYVGMAQSAGGDEQVRATSYSKGIEAFNRVLSLNPDHVVTLSNRGLAYRDIGEREKAVADLMRAVELQPESPLRHFQCAYVLMQSNRAAERRQAVEHAREAVSRDPDNNSFRIRLGVCLKNVEDHEESLAVLEEALRENPSSAQAWAWCADVHHEMKQYDEALDAVERALSLNPDLSLAFEVQAQVHGAQGNHEEALASWHRFLESCDRLSSSNLTGRGRAYLRLGQYSEALADFERAVGLGDGHGWITKSRGEAHFYLGNYERALEDLRRAVELGDTSALDWIPHQDLRACPHPEFRQGMIDIASDAIAGDPERPKLYRYRAQLHWAWRNYPDTIADCTRSIELGATSVRPLNLRALSYDLTGRPDLALEDFNRAIEARPDHHTYVANRGHLHLGQKRWAEAIADFERSLELKPDHEVALVRLPQAFEGAEDYTSAIAAWTRVIELFPEDAGHLLARSRAYRVAGDIESALVDEEAYLAAFQAAVEEDPENADLLNRRGVALNNLEQWDEAIADFTAALALDEGNPQYLRNRSAAHARLEQWAAGADDLAKLIAEDDSYRPRYELALLQARLGRTEAYRRSCRTMIERFAEADDVMSRHFAVWTSSLLPAALDDYTTAIAVAETMAAETPEDTSKQQNLGAILLRAGHSEESLVALNEAQRLWETYGDDSNSSPAYLWYLLALTHAELGDSDEAAEWLAQANERSGQELNDQEPPVLWFRKLTLELLREEAEGMIPVAVESAESPE